MFSGSSCEKSDLNDIGSQEIYFEYYTINNAWGLHYKHWIIDKDGKVLKHRNEDSIIWINTETIDEDVAKFDSIVYTIPKTELDYYVSLIPYANKGRISETTQGRADFGLSAYNCFYKRNNNYKKITLSEMSDMLDKTNLSSSALKIDTWLKNINSKLLP